MNNQYLLEAVVAILVDLSAQLSIGVSEYEAVRIVVDAFIKHITKNYIGVSEKSNVPSTKSSGSRRFGKRTRESPFSDSMKGVGFNVAKDGI